MVELDRQPVRWHRAVRGEGDVESARIVFLFEVNGEGVVLRQVELAGPDQVPIAAGSAEEWWEAQGWLRQATTPGLMKYEETFGRPPEGSIHEGGAEYPGEAITADEFECTWTAARQHLIASMTGNNSSTSGSNRYSSTRRSIGRGSGS